MPSMCWEPRAGQLLLSLKPLLQDLGRVRRWPQTWESARERAHGAQALLRPRFPPFSSLPWELA